MGIVGIILLVLAALLLLVLLCRVGVIATYSADGLTVRARLGWFKLTIIPMPKRKPKQKRAKKKPKTEKKPPKQAENHPNSLQTILKGGSISQLKELLELALAAAGDMIRHLRVEYLRLHYTFAGQPDPAGVRRTGRQEQRRLGAQDRPQRAEQQPQKEVDHGLSLL